MLPVSSSKVDNIDVGQAKLLVGYKYDLLVDLNFLPHWSKCRYCCSRKYCQTEIGMGLTGRADFQYQPYKVNGLIIRVVTTSCFYIADTPTTVNTTVFTVPVHQRNTIQNSNSGDSSPYYYASIILGRQLYT